MPAPDSAGGPLEAAARRRREAATAAPLLVQVEAGPTGRPAWGAAAGALPAEGSAR